DGVHVNSEFLNGLNNEEAINRMIEWLEANGIGKKKVTYRLRDWLFSRQRYWGEPIPIIHWEDGTMSALSEEDLPLELPEMRKSSRREPVNLHWPTVIGCMLLIQKQE